MKGWLLREIAQYDPFYTYMYLSLNVFIASKRSNLYILFVVTCRVAALKISPYIINTASTDNIFLSVL